MTETENLVEQLRLMRKEIADVKDGLAAVRVKISALDQQVAGLTTAVYSGHRYRTENRPDREAPGADRGRRRR